MKMGFEKWRAARRARMRKELAGEEIAALTKMRNRAHAVRKWCGNEFPEIEEAVDWILSLPSACPYSIEVLRDKLRRSYSVERKDKK